MTYTQKSMAIELGGEGTGFAKAVQQDIALILANLPPVVSAEITINANTTPMELTDESTYYQWETGWVHDQKPVGASIDLDTGSITVNVAARMATAILVNFTCDTASGLHISLFKNGSLVPDHLITRDVVTINSAIAVTITGIDDCAAGDVYDLRIENTSDAGTNVTVFNANFAVWAIGNPVM